MSLAGKLWTTPAAVGAIVACLATAARGGTETTGDVYTAAPKAWSEIFHALNTGSFSAKRLMEEFRNQEHVEREYATDNRNHFFTVDDFEGETVDVMVSGEMEWPLVLAGTGHLLQEPGFSKLLKLARQAASEDPGGRTCDPLQKARFQGDLRTAIAALKLFRDEPTFQMEEFGNKKAERSNHLIRELERVVETVLLTRAEIAALPDTGELEVQASPMASGLDQKRYFRWKGMPTVHERAHLFTIHNVVYVRFSGRDEQAFSRARIDEYISSGTRPRSHQYLMGLLDQLIVLDQQRQEHKTNVASLVRTARFGAAESRPWGDRLAQFDLRYLRRRATIEDWRSAIEVAPVSEPAAGLLDLPNVPGFMKPYYQVPVRMSCVHCHGERVILFSLIGEDGLKLPPERMAYGPTPLDSTP